MIRDHWGPAILPAGDNGLRATRIRHLRIPRAPLYPPLVTAAFVLFDYSASNVSLEALWRPLAVAIAVTILVQLALSPVLGAPTRAPSSRSMLQFAAVRAPSRR